MKKLTGAFYDLSLADFKQLLLDNEDIVEVCVMVPEPNSDNGINVLAYVSKYRFLDCTILQYHKDTKFEINVTGTICWLHYVSK